MKTNTLFVFTLFSLLLTSAACKRKCASAEDTGSDIWLGKTHIIAPSAFTPNNQDGINDTYALIELKSAPDTSQQTIAALSIKNFGLQITRDGELLFESYTWPGTWNGKNKNGKTIDGLVDVQYNLIDYEGYSTEGSFKLFVVPNGCLQECLQNHIFGDMINPYEGVTYPTKETFCP